jgi:hypothetical protein
MNYAIEQPSRDVLNIRMDVKAGWEQSFLLSSDRHHDNALCDHALERKHLEQAKARKAGVFDFGDLFCAMGGKWDKRADKAQLRDELRHGDYIDALVKYNADFYKPYAENFCLLTPGNHEYSVRKAHETNLTERLAERLGCRFGTYAGWVRFMFTINKTKRHSLWLYRHHGYGGGGPVTKGIIQTARQAVYLPDATFVVSGHTHDQWVFPIERARISGEGRPYLDTQWHVKCGGYKDEFTGGEGWDVERGGPPKPRGAVWLRFFADRDATADGRISFDLTAAT